MKYIGMDVHKASVMVSWVDEENHVMRPFRIPNTTEELLGFARAIERPAKIAVEATRNHAFVHDLLEGEGLDVFVSHPKDTEAIASSKKKSDRHDAITLAKLLKAELLTESYVPPLDVRLLRELVRDHIRLVSARTRAKNWIRSTIAQEGLTCSYRDIFGKSAKAWLASCNLHPMREASVERSLALIAALQEPIKNTTEVIEALVKDDPEIKLLTSIPGVGYVTAAAILSEIGDITRFKSDRQLASYAGLVTTTRESAGVVRHGHITKEGSATLRWALVMGTSHLIRRPGPLKAFYERVREKHGKKCARVATGRKLARYIFAILTSGKEYDPGKALQRGIECVMGRPP